MNLLLSGIWVALTGSLFYTNFLFGFMLGFFVLWIMNRNETDQRYFYRVPKVISFIFLLFIPTYQVKYPSCLRCDYTPLLFHTGDCEVSDECTNGF